MDEQGYLEREAGLKRGLNKAQITMIGLGGAIGTGLFMGSGIAIGYAGPAVLISYLIAAPSRIAGGSDASGEGARQQHRKKSLDQSPVPSAKNSHSIALR